MSPRRGPTCPIFQFMNLHGVRFFAAASVIMAWGTGVWTSAPVLAQQTSWTFRAEDQADLWFHGLALVGFEGFAPLPMYDRAYPERVRAAKSRAGIGQTRLAAVAAELGATFSADSAYEVLHFVPLYLVGADVPSLIEVLLASAAGRAPDTAVTGGGGEFAGTVLRSVLRTPDARRALRQFTDALRESTLR